MSTENRVETVRTAAEAGGQVALEGFRADIDVEQKSDKTDVVTEADRAAQRRVIEIIREAYPDDPIVGEEEDAMKRVPSSGPAWVVDPIDGTNNFVRDVPLWTTAVAAVVDGDAVAASNVMPALDDTFELADGTTRFNGVPATVSTRSDPETFRVVPLIWWGRDRRDEYAAACREIVTRFGDLVRPVCAQYVLGMVATGQVDGAITNVVPNPWDVVGGVGMVRAAGGQVTNLTGDRWTPGDEGLVASNGAAHAELQTAVDSVVD
ncbi:MAG: inositol monophosphatase [Halobacteriaceae archaeon]